MHNEVPVQDQRVGVCSDRLAVRGGWSRAPSTEGAANGKTKEDRGKKREDAKDGSGSLPPTRLAFDSTGLGPQFSAVSCT